MNSGKLCKNFTDGLLLALAFLSLVFVAFGYLSFGDGYIMDHPYTGEEIEVTSAFGDPYIKTYCVLGAACALTAMLGFAAHKLPLIGLLASVGNLVLAFVCFSRELIETWAIIYILVAVTGLAGNVIFTCFHYFENTTELNQGKGEK